MMDMKKNMKGIAARFLTAAIALSLTGCGGEPGSVTSLAPDAGSPVSASNIGVDAPDYLNTDSMLPIVKDGYDITLKVMISQGPMYLNMNSINDVFFVDAYEQKTNVKIEWTEVPTDAFATRLALALVSGDLTDVIIKGGVSNSMQLRYGNQGLFLNLMENDLLQNHAPNYWALTQQHPEMLIASMMPDDSVYSLGLTRNSPGSLIASRLFFNKDWLQRLNLSVPATIDEFHNVLNAFKNSDPNGNGRNDEVGLYIKHDHLEFVTFGMFGLGNRGRNNGFIDWDEENGQVRYFATSDAYRQWVSWIARLYKEGLLHQEYFDFSEANLSNFVSNDVCGAFAFVNLSMLNHESQQKYTFLNSPLTGNDGHSDWFGTNSIGSTGSYIITTAAEHPEVALRWADYFFTEEGSLFFYYGTEGVTFEKNDDGTFRYTDNVLADFHAGRNSYDGCASFVSLFSGGHTPTMTKFPFNSADDNRGIALEAAKALIERVPMAWPAFTFTNQEQRIIDDTRSDIDSYVRSMTEGWISGTSQLDDNAWQAYVDRIEMMGVSEVVEVYEAALGRARQNGLSDGFYSLSDFD